MTDSRYRSRYATKAWKMVCGCIAHGRAEDHMCPKKAELLAPRKCGYLPCPEVFTPTQPTQRFCSKSCNGKDRHRRGKMPNERKAERKGLSPEEVAVLEMAPLAKARAERARRAGTYLPVMGEALYEATMLCMRSEQ